MYRVLFFISLLFLNIEASFAASSIQLEVSSQGMATVDIELDLGYQSSTASSVRLLVLPFQLDPRHEITKPDDIEVTLVFSREKYALLVIIASKTAGKSKISITNAFNLIDDRAKDRVKFQFDMSYSNFKQYASLLKSNITISEFDIVIRLPRDYGKDELSFEPAKDKWTQIAPAVYSISKDAVTGKEVFLAFPSPFRDARSTAQLVIGAIAGLLAILLGSSYVARRRFGRLVLTAILVLSCIGLALLYYVYTSLADPLGFLAWVIGIALPWTLAPFLCVWFLIRLSFDAEISGDIYDGEQKARYVDAEIYLVNGDREKLLKRKTVDENGEYKAYVWCGFQEKDIIIKVDAEGFQPHRSRKYPVKSKSKTRIDRLMLTRIPLEKRAEGSAQDGAGQHPTGER